METNESSEPQSILGAVLGSSPIFLSLVFATLTTLLWQKGFRKGFKFALRAQTDGPVTNFFAMLSRVVLEQLFAQPPKAPTKIRVSRVGAHAVDLTFKGDLSQSKFVTLPTYEVRLRGREILAELGRPGAPQADEEGFWRKAYGRTTSLRLKDLFDDEEYILRVRAINGKGPGPWVEVPFYTRQEVTPFSGGTYLPEKHGKRSNEAVGSAVYAWSQDYGTVVARVELPREVRKAKDLRIDIQPRSLEVECRSGQMLLAGELYAAVRPDESTWEIEDPSSSTAVDAEGNGGMNLVLYLDKVKKDEPSKRDKFNWIGFLKGHPMVDFNHVARP
mmetsp:Transcript_4376/g.17196  ORF Transcript_4376/g.17196 Transcript_4376/m.17196 type:complete len:331 (-) Transcript_4376:51-1043(-)